MKKGVFFTMDAVFALYIALLFLSTMIVMLEASKNYSYDSLALARLSRDVYEVRKYNESVSLPSFLLNGSDCDNKEIIGSALVFNYNDIGYDAAWYNMAGISTAYEKVCIK
jgi:hypothetical protein